MLDPYQLDALAIRRGFSRAAQGFDDSSALQAEVRGRLLDRLKHIRGRPASILDLGAGTGHSSRELKRRFSGASVVAADFALPMLREARRRRSWFRKFDRICAAAGALPFRNESIDWCVSNLMLAWCEPLDDVLAEVHRVLKPGGLFTFSSLGPDSLRELRSAWDSVDPGPHVHRFIDMHDLGDAMVRAGFAEPVLDVERIVLTYDDPAKLIQELKQAGFATATAGRVRHLGVRQRLRALVAAYERLRVAGKAPATFEIVYGQAWRSSESLSRRDAGEVAIPLTKIGRRSRLD